MKRALLALGLAMASISVPLTFAKTNSHATKKATHKVKKHSHTTRGLKHVPVVSRPWYAGSTPLAHRQAFNRLMALADPRR